MKESNKSQTIPKSIFQEAALKYFKCKPNDIEIRMIIKNKAAFVLYNEEYYKISTREMLCETLEDQLLDKDAVHHINFGCWIEATRHTVKINRFLDKLISKLQHIGQANMLFTAIGLASYADDLEVAFWKILARIDKDGDLLGNAMVSVAQVYDGAGLVDDLLELQIIHGEEVYNRVEDGIFEAINVENASGDDTEFFIYSVEDYPFE